MDKRPPLHPEQEKIIVRLLRFVNDPPGEPPPGLAASASPPRSAAVVGSRGIGKSTVLAAFRHDLQKTVGAQTRWLIPLPILDAAIIRDDLGLAAAAIRGLEKTVNWNSLSVGRDRSEHLREELKKSSRRCIESALLQEESHRRLAQELAMTPGHYGKMVFDAHDRKAEICIEFGQFIDCLAQVHRAGAHRAGSEHEPSFVVLVDDLDLGPPRAVYHWVRALLTDYCDHRVYWILAFDREPLTLLLSRPPDGENRNDANFVSLANGQALLSKAVPNSRQWELRRWTSEERQAFQPISSSPGSASAEGSQTARLRELLIKSGRGDMLTLLPAHPRALEGEYFRLSQEDPPSAEEMLRRIALVSGEAGLVRRLDERGGALLGSSLRWKEREALSEAGWLAIIEAARDEGPLWGLPLPEDFSQLVAGPDPEAFLETLLDISLAAGKLTPYQLLQRLPFASIRLQGAHSQLRVPEQNVLKYLSPETSAETHLVSTALAWQRWSDEADKDRFWNVDLGPSAFWEFCLRQRAASPEPLFNALYLPRIPIAPRPTDLAVFLPRRLRPLLLLVDGLSQAAWQALGTAWNFWSPITFTRCVAAFTLAGYVRHRPVSLEEAPQLLRLTHRESSKELLALTEPEVLKAFRDFVHWLEQQTLAAPAQASDSPYGLASAELAEVLATFLHLPSVIQLSQGELS